MKRALAWVTVWMGLLPLLLGGCGGGGAGAAPGQLAVIPGSAATPTPVPAGGPVSYLQNSSALSSGGTIPQGAHEAIIAVISGADANSESFASDRLVVTSGTSAQSAARMRASSGRSVLAMRPSAAAEAFPADEHPITPRLRAVSGSVTSVANRVRESTLPANAVLGSQAGIWVQTPLAGGARANTQVPATLLAQTPHANVWVDNAIVPVLRGQAGALSQDVENAYVSDTAHFASPDYPSGAPGLQPQYSACSSSGGTNGTTPAYITQPLDHRINVMVVNAPSLGGLGGYFSAENYMRQAALNCLSGNYRSNEAPFIFVGWFGSSGTQYDLREDLVRSTAHELQHLINFVNHSILAPGAASPSFNGAELTFINEGLSMLAQDYAVGLMYKNAGIQFDADDALARASVYLANPGNYSLSSFTGIDPSNWGGNGTAQYNCDGGCYGVAYLFQRYLADRFGGDRYTRQMEMSGAVGTANLQRLTGESAGDLQGDFALAMAAGTMHVAAADPRFNFGALSLVSSYSDQFGASTQLSGVYALPQDGSATTVRAPVGGFAYVAIPSVPSSGMPVQITDQASASGFGLMGGLAQH